MRCARDILDRISEEKSMSKKWLYGVALGALLIAQSSLGVTVHEVLSKGFFSEAEHRATLESLTAEGGYARKVKHLKPKDGMERSVVTYKSASWSPSKWKWKGVRSYTNDGELDCVYNLKNKQKHHIEKTKGNQHRTEGYVNDDYVTTRSAQEMSTIKPRGKGARPLGPFVVYDWLPDTLSSNEFHNMQFNGTEETATTNIVSDTEAYITRTIRQSGWVQDFFGFIVEEPASLLRTYNMHITTDADHVYIHQDINETAQNAFSLDTQRNYATDYTATFKNDRCVRETETIQKNETDQTSAWLRRYYNGDEATDVATVSVNTQSSLKAKHARLARTDDSKQRSQ